MEKENREALRKLYKEAIPCMEEQGGRISAVVNPEKLSEFHNTIDQMLPEILDCCDTLEAKVEYAKEFGLVIGVLKTSDCPEGRLAHDTAEGSTLKRLEGEMVRAVELEVERDAGNERIKELNGFIEALNNGITRLKKEKSELVAKLEYWLKVFLINLTENITLIQLSKE